ncbi:FimB/Mfa2 family fimbrial subunit [Bacteroides sp. GM023]|uniref:FimB/Mfa2 family fimbrial subunit n=1 Tax=Bacteroides sp. GM023 TaxID=2723058 RepID=UPI00168ABE9E|nr:FimB/Mfa2 family fimbrial subunit [Bacteroides sp. GM023]MBD3591382.1 FimB/Mfa2 family fimbrial subunit [Bacteroides sp. GM023]
MKYSKLTYYLLAILCMIATSCVTDGVMDDRSDNSDENNPALIKGGKVNLILSFPTTDTRGIIGETGGLEGERKINDVQIYTFFNDRFIEEVQNILISGTDGSTTRRIEGRLSETYASKGKMEFVVIANAKSKDVTNISLNKGISSKNDLYQQLTYTYASNNWTENIPMWGVSSVTLPITEGGYNVGEVALRRAIAKVNVTVNDGNGLKGFEITEIKLENYNTKGYCAPIPAVADGQPSVPADATCSTKALTSGPLSGAEGNNFADRFYIPEHKNIGVDDSKKIYLTITATINGSYSKTYTLPFVENNMPYDVLRNYIYIFNIVSVKTEFDCELAYEVLAWDTETVIVPPFN